jgi:hypothetical protein
MHMWRKRVKDLRYASEMLDRVDPAEGRGTARRSRTTRWRKRRQRHGETNAIRRIARRADELGELLGDEHDLVLLATRVIGEGEGSAPQARAERWESSNAGSDEGTAAAGDVGPARADAESEDAAPAPAGIGRAEAVGTADREGTDAASEEVEHELGANSRVDDGMRSILLKLIEQRRRRLRKEALRRGERLYRRRPKTFISRTRHAYERAADR